MPRRPAIPSDGVPLPIASRGGPIWRAACASGAGRMTTVALLPQHLLSKEKLLAHVLRGLEADLAPKNQLKADASKATQRERQTQLTAPVDGVIQQLAIHTTGDLVTSAQPLMIVVPDSTEVTEGINVEPRLTSNPMQCLHQRGDMTTLTRRSTVTLD